MGSVLEVDVNGEETFFVNKRVLSTSSIRLQKLFRDPSPSPAAATGPLKVIFHGFPGGPEAFELLARWCYGNRGVSSLTPNCACLLHSASKFMDVPELVGLTAKFLEEIPNWTWHETVNSLKLCRDGEAVNKIVHHLVARIAAGGDTSPSGSSPESSAFRISCDTKSTISTRNSTGRAWWFDDLVVFQAAVIERVVKALMAKMVDPVTIGMFLLHYLKCRLATSASDEKKMAVEIVIDLLDSLPEGSVSCKRLFRILRVSIPLKVNESCQRRLETMVGSQLDQSTLDNLLVPSQPGAVGSLYDVDLILRFLECFLISSAGESIPRMKKVGKLMDFYLAEVAPDPCLSPAKFLDLINSLPPAARDCHDALYHAVDTFLQVHSGSLPEAEKVKICGSMKLDKLSPECCKHLASNRSFPTRTAVQALVSQHSMLKNLICESDHSNSPERYPGRSSHRNPGEEEQVVLYSRKVDLSTENENLKTLLEGMQWRVMELEKMCMKMKTQVSRMNTKKNCRSGVRSLPKLCS